MAQDLTRQPSISALFESEFSNSSLFFQLVTFIHEAYTQHILAALREPRSEHFIELINNWKRAQHDFSSHFIELEELRKENEELNVQVRDLTKLLILNAGQPGAPKLPESSIQCISTKTPVATNAGHSAIEKAVESASQMAPTVEKMPTSEQDVKHEDVVGESPVESSQSNIDDSTALPASPNMQLQMCPVCKKTVVNLQSHMQQHSACSESKSPLTWAQYRCPLCHMFFNAAGELDAHLKVHETPSTTPNASADAQPQTCMTCYEPVQDIQTHRCSKRPKSSTPAPTPLAPHGPSTSSITQVQQQTNLNLIKMALNNSVQQHPGLDGQTSFPANSILEKLTSGAISAERRQEFSDMLAAAFPAFPAGGGTDVTSGAPSPLRAAVAAELGTLTTFPDGSRIPGRTRIRQVCHLCHKEVYNLADHMKTHSDERPHVCTKCPMSFKRKGDLNRHLRNTHNEKVGNVHTPPNLNHSSDSLNDPMTEYGLHF